MLFICVFINNFFVGKHFENLFLGDQLFKSECFDNSALRTGIKMIPFAVFATVILFEGVTL